MNCLRPRVMIGLRIAALHRDCMTTEAPLAAVLVDYRMWEGDGQQLVHYEKEAGWQSAAKLLGKIEARRIGANVANLPGYLANTI